MEFGNNIKELRKQKGLRQEHALCKGHNDVECCINN